MRRRDFLKGLSAFVPATLLAKLALPKIEEVATVEAVEPEYALWDENGQPMTPEFQNFLENSDYFCNGGRVIRYEDNHT